MKHAMVISLLSASLLAGCGMMGSREAPAKSEKGALVGSRGMTLYTFDKDRAGDGTSACVDKCAQLWPPLHAAAEERSSGDWSVIRRADGSRQWAYKGKPLYYWSKDQNPGDRTGDGVNNAWHVARP
jgi:predicted lipoprotein with Yx(FWY)xxD motif